ncbi:MAG: leucine-rich repeat domain-containing protein [Oscillospiraceae bacterium]|nr:leucine-rich repeat domain-containing protein [Oscillospiraceae bacterium]
MKKPFRNMTSLVSAAVMCAAFAAQMQVSASAAGNFCENETARFKYTIRDNTAEITDVAGKGFTDETGRLCINVPSEIEALPVVIGSFAFSEMNEPVQINCADVTAIRNNAFFCCSGISEFVVGKKCEKISPCAFYDCDNLESVLFDGSETAVEDDSRLEIESYAFNNCDNLRSIQFKCRDDIIIKPKAFYGCMNLKDLDENSVSQDHSSLYVQEGAFIGTGIVNNPNAVRTADYMKEHNARYNRGDAKKLKGNVLIVNLLVASPDHKTWNPDKAKRMRDDATNDSILLEQEAEKYGVEVSIDNAFIEMYSDKDRYDRAEDFVDTSNEVLNAVKSEYPFLYRYKNMKDATQALKAFLGYDEIAYVVFAEGNWQSAAYAKRDYEYDYRELAYVYTEWSNSRNHEYAWMHEVCHLFGAMDVYPIRDVDADYTGTYMNGDVMEKDKWPNIGWFIACNLGWTDTVLTKDYNAVIGENTPACNFD